MILFNASGKYILPSEVSNNGLKILYNKIMVEETLFGLNIIGVYLNRLLPKDEYFTRASLLSHEESEFDNMYWDQLTNDPSTHSELVNCIISVEANYAKDCIIIIYTENTPYAMSVTESLQMYLRYIYNIDTKIIMSEEDLEFPGIFDGLTTFTGDGIYMVDKDLKEYGGNSNE